MAQFHFLNHEGHEDHEDNQFYRGNFVLSLRDLRVLRSLIIEPSQYLVMLSDVEPVSRPGVL